MILWLRRTPSRLAPSRSMARCDRRFSWWVIQPTRITPSVPNARSISISLASAFTPVRCQSRPIQVEPM
jgi:hypothetical protein